MRFPLQGKRWPQLARHGSGENFWKRPERAAHDHPRFLQHQIYWQEVLLNFCTSVFKESPHGGRKKKSMTPPFYSHLCAEEGKIRDQFQWIIRKQHPSRKYVKHPYRMLGHCDWIGFTEVTMVFDIKSTTDFLPQKAVALCYAPNETRQPLWELFVRSPVFG